VKDEGKKSKKKIKKVKEDLKLKDKSISQLQKEILELKNTIT